MSPALNPHEAAMMEMLRQVELEDSMLSDHEVRHKSVVNVFFVPFLVVCGEKSPNDNISHYFFSVCIKLSSVFSTGIFSEPLKRKSA